MKIEVEEMPSAQRNVNPLIADPRYPCHFIGHEMFLQVVSSITEGPVKIILHDRATGVRKMLTVVQEPEDFKIAEKMMEATTSIFPKYGNNSIPQGRSTTLRSAAGDPLPWGSVETQGRVVKAPVSVPAFGSLTTTKATDVSDSLETTPKRRGRVAAPDISEKPKTQVQLARENTKRVIAEKRKEAAELKQQKRDAQLAELGIELVSFTPERVEPEPVALPRPAPISKEALLPAAPGKPAPKMPPALPKFASPVSPPPPAAPAPAPTPTPAKIAPPSVSTLLPPKRK